MSLEKYRIQHKKIDNLMTKSQKTHFKNITYDFMLKYYSNEKIGVFYAKSINKNGKTYRVNSINKIKLKNHERENAIWLVELLGGKIHFLPEIHSEESVNMADYKYFPRRGKSFFIENKEIILLSNQKNVSASNISHKIEENKNQSNVYLIDVTMGNLSDYEILIRVEKVYTNQRTKFRTIILIIKNNNDLFGIFANKKSEPPESSGSTH